MTKLELIGIMLVRLVIMLNKCITDSDMMKLRLSIW